MAWALEELHKGECLHRDVKGDNILVEPKGRAVLTDFGSGTWKGAPPLTEWVVPPNTREYRSPESLRFEWSHWRQHRALYETRPADDLYALGVTAYRLVTGVYPPPGTDPEALKEQVQLPVPRRRPVHELNRRVVPELSALIERMLAREPEARGTAREFAEAAAAAAEQAGPEADVPFLNLEWPEARAQAVPLQAAPPANLVPPAAKAEGVPVRVPTERRGSCSESRVRAVAAMGGFVLLVVALVSRGPAPQAELPAMAQAEEPAAGWAPDAGTRGLGDDALAARVDSEGVPIAPESVSRDLPPQPVPGQQRVPCKRKGEVPINGGCWVHLTNIEPPCGEEEYEWQGSCYRPSGVRSRPPTSKKPQ
jgi:hypothetical protein